ncbi:MAG TPA: hypothetical protein VFC31_01040 [Candidatus Limnocylindria bacterium]|nr:hypothetical protein [Candidatus Limnocylindria bacterium]
MSGIDMNSFLLGAAVVLVVFLAIDLLVAGGGMTGGMMGGVAGMMGTPWGWLVLVLLAAALFVALAGR